MGVVVGLAVVMALSGCGQSGASSSETIVTTETTTNSSTKTSKGTTAKTDSTTSKDTSTKTTSDTSSKTASSKVAASVAELKSEDTTVPSIDSANAIITLATSGDVVEGTGAIVKGDNVVIQKGGTYVLRGEKTKGQVIVYANKEDTVNVILDGVTLYNKSATAFYGQQSDKVVITLAKGSVNKISDGGTYTTTGQDAPTSPLYVQDDLTLNGTGSLTVVSKNKSTLVTKDDLVIVSGNYSLEAENNGIIGRDSVSIYGGNFKITSKGDGIKSNNDKDTAKGWVRVDGGNISIVAAKDGIQSTTLLNINGGTLDITSVEDGIHGKSDVTVKGGDITVKASDDAIHSDTTLTVLDGTIDVQKSYEGLEGSNVIIAGGKISIKASDDGVNSAGSAGSRGSYNMTIKGGEIYVNSGGDGLDANGDIVMSGGSIKVEGPTSGSNSALDFDGQYLLSGGTLLASGTTRMLSPISTSSTQPSVTVIFTSAQRAGAEISLLDSSNQKVLSTILDKNSESLIMSGENLIKGETYTISINGQAQGQVTLDSVVKMVSSDGTAVNLGGRGGRGGRGGH